MSAGIYAIVNTTNGHQATKDQISLTKAIRRVETVLAIWEMCE